MKRELTQGEHIHFVEDDLDWEVRQVSDRWVILTAHDGKDVRYTIIDWERDLRGPCNLIGGGWSGIDSDFGVGRLMRALEYDAEVLARLSAGEKSVQLTEIGVEVSHSRSLRINIRDTPSETPA